MKKTQTKRVTNVTTYEVQCKKCKKVIRGYSAAQLKWNLDLHQNKHRRQDEKE